MITFSVSFISGIFAFNFFSFFPFSITVLCILAGLFLFVITPSFPLTPPLLRRNTKWLKRGRVNFRSKILIVLVFIFGFFYSLIRYETLPEVKFTKEDVFIEGIVIDVPEMSEGKLRFKIDEVVIDGEEIQGMVRFVILPELFGKVFAEDLLAPGDRISTIAKLREPTMFRNPGVYSYDLKKDGIIATGYIKQMQVRGIRRGLLTWIYKNRQRLGRIIDNSLSEENAPFLKAIITGLKKGVKQDMRDDFSATGLAHLLSISGTHFGLLAFIIFQFIRIVIKYLPAKLLAIMTLYITPAQIAILLTLPALVLYALISGTSTPTVRSLIMVFIYMLAHFLGRRGQWLNSLSIAAVLILLWHPNTVFELSFQLSFLAVLSIGYVLENRTQMIEPCTAPGTGEHRARTKDNPPQSPFPKGGAGGIIRIFERVKTAILITIAAVFGTAPIVALYFKQFPIISPITNLIVTPLICFIILPLGFFSGFYALFFDMTSMPFSGLIDAITFFALKLVTIFSDIPYANFHVHNPPVIMIVLYYFSLIFLVKFPCLIRNVVDIHELDDPPQSHFKKGGLFKFLPLAKGGRGDFWTKTKFKWRFLPFVLVMCFYFISPCLSNNELKITFLDVGQGDVSLVKLPDKRIMLIDGGTYEPDMGRGVIAPYLWSKGMRNIDCLVLSHPHPDHYGGLIYIMNNFDIGEIWLNGRVISGSEKFFETVKENKIPLKILKRGNVYESEGYKIYVFHPYGEFYAHSPRGEYSSENSDSLVFKIQSVDASILFTGDIESEAEENLVYLGKWLRSDIIKVPHHGGRASSSSDFIKAVNPLIAVVSAGKNNSFHHPHQDVLERYKNTRAKLLRTDFDGAITITSRDRFYEIETYRDSIFKKALEWEYEIRNLKLLF